MPMSEDKISVRVTPERKEEIRKRASALKMNIADYFRSLLDGDATTENKSRLLDQKTKIDKEICEMRAGIEVSVHEQVKIARKLLEMEASEDDARYD